MRLAMQTDDALRMLMYLAFRQERANAADDAEFYGISASHVAKVVNQLARWGTIRSIRGAGGGIELARNPADVTVGEVIAAFEGPMHLLDCVGTPDVCQTSSFSNRNTHPLPDFNSQLSPLDSGLSTQRAFHGRGETVVRPPRPLPHRG